MKKALLSSAVALAASTGVAFAGESSNALHVQMKSACTFSIGSPTKGVDASGEASFTNGTLSIEFLNAYSTCPHKITIKTKNRAMTSDGIPRTDGVPLIDYTVKLINWTNTSDINYSTARHPTLGGTLSKAEIRNKSNKNPLTLQFTLDDNAKMAPPGTYTDVITLMIGPST